VTTYSAELADLLLALFTVGQNGLLAKWKGQEATLPNPLQKDFKTYPSGSRFIIAAMAFPQFVNLPLPGTSGEVQDVGTQRYDIDIFAAQKWEDRDRAFPAKVRQELVHYLLTSLSAWCEDVELHQVTQPADYTLHRAAVVGGNYYADSPLTELGWFTVAVRVSVIICQSRETPS